MEVHHHAHTSGKKWTHYIWEFLMLFLAVFCGFIAENIREHMVETKRAENFAAALVVDLESDLAEIDAITWARMQRDTAFNKLLSELEKNPHLQNDTVLFEAAVKNLTRRSYFSAKTGTYQQIKNSGSMRYFKQSIATLLVEYERFLNTLDIQLDIENKYVLENAVNLRSKFCNKKYVHAFNIHKDFEPNEPLVNKDSSIEAQVYTVCDFLLERNASYLRSMSNLKETGTELMKEIKEEYHIVR